MPTNRPITFIGRTPRATPQPATTAPCPTCGGDKARAYSKGSDVEHVCEQGHVWLLKGKD
jgi:hypothetical protein